jgi:transposase
MPKLVCVKCQTELRAETNGTLVIETASFGPYKVWNADTWKCPGCGIEIVAGFGDRPLRQDHYEPGFDTWLEKVKSYSKRVEYDHERPTTRTGE